MEFIAEIGWNFMGDLGLAREMITAAKESGASTAKFQYWSVKNLKPGPWDHDGRREIYESAELTAEKISSLQDMCTAADIDFLVSCFNANDAAFLKSLGTTRLKIPSHEVANRDLHVFAAQAFEKIYVSLGAGSAAEVRGAAEVYNKAGADWVGMHCVSSYPCPLESANINRIKWLENFVPTIGFSDHTSEVITPALAVALGATVIEKHFTTDTNLPGRDNKFAVTPEKFREMTQACEQASLACRLDTMESLEIEQDTIANYRGRWG